MQTKQAGLKAAPFASYAELMAGIAPLSPVDILSAAKRKLDKERQRIGRPGHIKERAAICLIHAIAHAKAIEKAA